MCAMGAAGSERVVGGEASWRNVWQEGRFGSTDGLDVLVGATAQGVLDVVSEGMSLGEDVCTITSTLVDKPIPTSAVVLGGFVSFCSMLTGMLPLEAGARLFLKSRGGGEGPEDVWGEARGLSNMVTGGSLILGSFFNLFSRVVSVMSLWGMYIGVHLLPELVALGGSAGLIGSVGGIVVMLSMSLFSLISLVEGQLVRSKIAHIMAKSKNSKEALGELRRCLGADPIFEKQLERTTKEKVLSEIRTGNLDEKTRRRFVEKNGLVDPTWDPEGAVLQHIFMKLDKRRHMHQWKIALSVFSMALIVLGLIVSGGSPLIVVMALGIVETLMWLSIDIPGLLKSLKKGDAGSKDRVVLLVTALLLVGLIVASATFSTGVVGLAVMTSIAGVCIGLHLIALWSLRKVQSQKKDQAKTGSVEMVSLAAV